MNYSSNLKKSHELILYNNILSLSRNKLFYSKFALADTFHNRISLIFFDPATLIGLQIIAS